MQAIVKNKSNMLSDLRLANIDAPRKMSSRSVYLSHTALGISYDDVLLAKGAYGYLKYDKDLRLNGDVIGLEGVGIVKKIGSNVANVNVGDRVIYGFGSAGSFQHKRLIDYSLLTKIPNDISDFKAASCFRKALMVHTLLFKVLVINQDQTILVNNADRVMEKMLCMWAKRIGLKVIARVNKPVDLDVDLVIDKRVLDIKNTILQKNEKMLPNIVFDSSSELGALIPCMQTLSAYVQYSPEKPLSIADIGKLRSNSLFFTSIMLEHYKVSMREFFVSANDVFNAIRDNFFEIKYDSLRLQDAGRVLRKVSEFDDRNYILTLPH